MCTPSRVNVSVNVLQVHQSGADTWLGCIFCFWRGLKSSGVFLFEACWAASPSTRTTAPSHVYAASAPPAAPAAAPAAPAAAAVALMDATHLWTTATLPAKKLSDYLL